MIGSTVKFTLTDRFFTTRLCVSGALCQQYFLLVPRPPRSAVAGDFWIRVRPSVCLSVRPVVCLSVSLSVRQFFRWVSIPRPNSTSTGQNRIKLSTMKEYILKLRTWVLVLSCDQNWGRTTWSKMRNFNTNWSLLFRERTPQLRGRIK